MNKPKATRLGLCMAVTLIAVISAFAPSAFGAITPEASTIYGSTVPGAHTDYTIIQKYQYDSNGPEPTGSTGPVGDQDLKKWIVDSPAGLVGNPNAIPYEDRCDPASFDPSSAPAKPYNTFFTGSCPDSALVGDAQVYTVNDATSGTCPNANPVICLLSGTGMYKLPDAAASCPGLPPYAAPPGAACPLQGKIYILKGSPEIPVVLGTLFTSKSFQNFDFSAFGGNVCTTAPATPCPIQPKTRSVLGPVTNLSPENDGVTDFRIRTIPEEYNSKPTALLPTAYGHAALPGTPLHIERIDQQLYGMVDPNETPGDTADDVPFLTMPARCDSWDSQTYAIAYNGGGGTKTMDPNHPGDNTYQESNVDSVAPDCSSIPPLQTAASSVLSTGARDANPGLNVKVVTASPEGKDQPKKLVTTLPPAVSVDVDALNNVCTTAQRNADACPAASQVGTASIATPLIQAGLTGRVYMTTGATASLPFLSIFVDGAVKFRLDATTKFVGADFNQIETTFDNLPQTPFTDFTVNINGGTSSSLLYNRACPVDGSAPPSGSTTFNIAGYAGNSTSSSSANAFDGCSGVSNPSKITKCVKQGKKLRVTPKGLIAKPDIKSVQLLTGSKKTNMKKRATDTSSPFSFKLTLKKSKYKAGKTFRYGYRVEYKDGKVIKTKSNTFKTCKKSKK